MTLESNKAVVRRYIEEVINRGNLALIDTLFAPELAERVKGFLASADSGPFPDGQEEICDIIAEGNTVMVRWIFRATHLGAFMGIPPTGKRIEITGYGTYYLENDRIFWDTMSMDWDDAMEQLGVTYTALDG
jgi:predicted ester cyclase